MKDYVCKIATITDVIKKYDYEKENNDDKDNWEIWKESAVERVKNNKIVIYHGVLNDKIICECTAAFDKSIVQNSAGLIDSNTAYLYAFRTISEYQNKGYFSILFNYMLEDLKKRGYKRLTLGVEPDEIRNKKIYSKYGFINHIKDSIEVYPDGTEVKVEYYEKII